MVDIDWQAPVTAEAATEIRANPDEVWDRLANVEGWPEWNSEVKSVELDGAVAEGSVFRWKGGRRDDHFDLSRG